jgi:hypothetical protein
VILRLNNYHQCHHHAAVARIDDYIYVSGGKSPKERDEVVSTMIRYHIPTRTWSSCPSMLSAREKHGMVRLPEPKSHCLMVMGGVPGSLHSVSSCEIFNTLTNEWSSAPSMPYRREYFDPRVLNHRIYVFGGTCETSCVYDTHTSEWCDIQQSTMTDGEGASGPYGTPVVVGDDAILFLGYDARRRIEQYTPSTDSWRILRWKLPDDELYPRYNCCAVFDSSTDSLLIIGGFDQDGYTKDSYVRYPPLHLKTNEWVECSNDFEYQHFGYCT